MLLLDFDDLEPSPPIVLLMSIVCASIVSIIILCCVLLRKISKPTLTRHNFNVPSQYQYDLEAQILVSDPDLTPKQRFFYQRLGTFQQLNPANLQPLGDSYNATTELVIKERGINAFSFENYADDFLQPRYIIEDKTELKFIHNAASTTDDNYDEYVTSVLNYSLPVKNRLIDTIYFETKLFEFNPLTDLVAIGLVTKPYPSFAAPGYSDFSIGIETNGNLRINNPSFDSKAILLPQLQQSDVIGIGYKYQIGTIFITHNGHKVMDIVKNVRLDLYPAIGAVGNCTVQVNIGQSGFVFIEANVKKWGFVTNNNLNGNIGAPPVYDKDAIKKGEVVLDKGEVLPPDYPESEEDFFGWVGSSSHVIVDGHQKEIVDEATPLIQKGTPDSDPPTYLVNYHSISHSEGISTESEGSNEDAPLLENTNQTRKNKKSKKNKKKKKGSNVF